MRSDRDVRSRDCLFVKSPAILLRVGEVDKPKADLSVVEVDGSDSFGLGNEHAANRIHAALAPIYAKLLEPRIVRLDGSLKGFNQLFVVRHGFETSGCACSGGQG
jgi:hypothetical protein